MTDEYIWEYPSSEFIPRVRTLCDMHQVPISHVEKAIGAVGGYLTNTANKPTDYDIRKVSEFFGISKAEFMAVKPYEILKVPRLTFRSCDYTENEWAVISRAIKDKKNDLRKSM